MSPDTAAPLPPLPALSPDGDATAASSAYPAPAVEAARGGLLGALALVAAKSAATGFAVAP